MSKTKNNLLLIFLIFILVLTLIFNIYTFKNLSKVFEVRELDASVIVGDRIGFDVNSSAFTFGSVLKGGSSTRKVSIENDFGFPVEVYVYGKGEMKEFIIPFRERIEKDEKKELMVSIRIPDSADFGKYKGKVIIRIEKLKE